MVVLCLLLLLISVLFMLGCVITFQQSSNDVNQYTTYLVFVYVDNDTGINYLIFFEHLGYAGMSGICPRYNVDGTLYVPEIAV